MHPKLTQHCKSTIIQQNLKKNRRESERERTWVDQTRTGTAGTTPHL